MPFPTANPRTLTAAVAAVNAAPPSFSRNMPTVAFRSKWTPPAAAAAMMPATTGSTSLPTGVAAPNSLTAGAQLERISHFAAPRLPPVPMRAPSSYAPINPQSLLQTPVATYPSNPAAQSVPASSGSTMFDDSGAASLPPVSGGTVPPPAPSPSDFPDLSAPSTDMTMPDGSTPAAAAAPASTIPWGTIALVGGAAGLAYLFFGGSRS